jgi:hypothetical protein
MMSRDPQTLEFCASNAISPGYFLIYPRSDAAPRYRKFLEDWNKAGWLQAGPGKGGHPTSGLAFKASAKKPPEGTEID